MSLAVLTIVKDRADHLAQLVEGLRRSAVPPAELIVVDMASSTPVAVADMPFAVRMLRLDAGGLPLAAARNLAARSATADRLLFLDVDCIPMRGLVGAMADALDATAALVCAEILYLGPDDARGAWAEAQLATCAARHPARTFPDRGLRREPDAGLFWSLAFGIARTRFFDLGGFDEAFTGYGAEDTDFGFRARAAALPLLFMGGPGAFHQYHDGYDPPLQHFEDIVRNARTFHARWAVWPMDGWLAAFAAMGLVRHEAGRLDIVRRPTAAEIARARLGPPVRGAAEAGGGDAPAARISAPSNA